MPTKQELEIRRLLINRLREDEQILHYGEAKPAYWQSFWIRFRQWDSQLQISPAFAAIYRLTGIIIGVGLVVLLLFTFAVCALYIIALGTEIIRSFDASLWPTKIFPFFIFLMLSIGAVVTLNYISRTLWDNWIFQEPIQRPKADEIVQNIAYIITSERIFVFDNDGLEEYPFELLTDTVLSKPQNGLSSISLYTSKSPKPKLPEPNYRLLDIPEEEAQTAYEILQEAREDVLERSKHGIK